MKYRLTHRYAISEIKFFSYRASLEKCVFLKYCRCFKFSRNSRKQFYLAKSCTKKSAALAFFMAFMALGEGAAAFIAFMALGDGAAAFIAFGIVKGGAAKSACRMFDLTKLESKLLRACVCMRA